MVTTCNIVLFDVHDADTDGCVSVDDFVSVLTKVLSEPPAKLRPSVEAKLTRLFKIPKDSFVSFDAFCLVRQCVYCDVGCTATRPFRESCLMTSTVDVHSLYRTRKYAMR